MKNAWGWVLGAAAAGALLYFVTRKGNGQQAGAGNALPATQHTWGVRDPQGNVTDHPSGEAALTYAQQAMRGSCPAATTDSFALLRDGVEWAVFYGRPPTSGLPFGSWSLKSPPPDYPRDWTGGANTAEGVCA